MKDLNHVVLVGRCTRDATMKYTVGGMAIGSFSIAVNRSVKKGDGWANEASFFDCVLYGKIAESVDRYLVKGKQVAVEGELHQKRWEQDGQARSKVEIVVSSVQLLGGEKNKEAQESAQNRTNGDIRQFESDIPF